MDAEAAASELSPADADDCDMSGLRPAGKLGSGDDVDMGLIGLWPPMDGWPGYRRYGSGFWRAAAAAACR